MEPQSIDSSVQFLKSKAPFTPKIGVICGSGLGGLANVLDDRVEVPYGDIPGFPTTTVPGHSGVLVFGTVGENKTEVVLLKGRFHSYEGHHMKTVGLPAIVFKKIGCQIMLVTNAAGGINRSFNIGDLMVISDHIGIPLLAGKHPLLGHNDGSMGERFPPMSNAYDEELRKLLIKTAEDQKISFLRKSGTYVFVSGPAFETGAESRALKMLGADAVGMSTVPEVVTARHAGLRVLGMSMITNKVVLPGDSSAPASHQEVLDTAKSREGDVERLVKALLNSLGVDDWEKTIGNVSLKDESADDRSIIEQLRNLDVMNLTPLQALQKLAEWKQNLC